VTNDLDRSIRQRIRLVDLAKQYLVAVLAREATGLPLGVGFRATENTREVTLTEGIWRSATEFPGAQYFPDPQTGEIVVMGAMRDAETLSPFMLRLKISHDAIVEAEVIVSPNRSGPFSDVIQLLKPDVLYDAPVPPERSSDRQQLVAIANSYWTALQESDGSLARFSYRCDKYDNGAKTTNTLRTLLSPDAAVHTCQSALNATRAARPLARERRFPTVDVALGVVTSLVMVDFHPILDSPRDDAGTFYMMGAFKVVDGEIRVVDEIRIILPLYSKSGWVQPPCVCDPL
jgi:hypothetical protein